MGLFSSRNKKMSNVKFFFIVLIVSVVIAIAIVFPYLDGEGLEDGLLIAFFASFYLTLLRILKNSNAPGNRLGNWKYFFTLFLIVAGLFVLLTLFLSQDEEDVVISLFAAFVISSVVSIWRGVKHWYQQRKAEKERKKQYQDRLQRENQQYADELEKKDRIIRNLQSRNSELQRTRQSNNSSSQSQNDRWRQAEDERRREEQWEREQDEKWEREQKQRKQRQLEDWYNEYVTIEVNFEYHIKDSEYNQDYWDYRSEDIRVTRREAMALIQAGEGAIIGRLGYGNRANMRNISYKVPYGLYNRPLGC